MKTVYPGMEKSEDELPPAVYLGTMGDFKLRSVCIMCGRNFFKGSDTRCGTITCVYAREDHPFKKK